MSITVTSTTDSKEAIAAATGDLKTPSKPVEEKSASAEKADETKAEASDTSEEEVDSNDESDSDEEESESKDEGKPKKSRGFKKRIDKLNAKVSAKEQEVEHWKAVALRSQTSDAPKSAPETPKKVEATGKPSSDDFDTHEAYFEALSDWKHESREKERDEKAKQTQVKTEFEKQVASHMERVSAFKESHDDFDEVIKAVDHIQMPVVLQDALLVSDDGPDLMYELAKNADEYKRICSLPPLEAVRALGKFEAKLVKEENVESKPIQTTKAPPPLKTVGSKGSGLSTKAPDQMDFQEFKKWREKPVSRA
jgi:hypothetical protein